MPLTWWNSCTLFCRARLRARDVGRYSLPHKQFPESLAPTISNTKPRGKFKNGFYLFTPLRVSHTRQFVAHPHLNVSSIPVAMATSPEHEGKAPQAQEDPATTTQYGNHSYLIHRELLIGRELIDSQLLLCHQTRQSRSHPSLPNSKCFSSNACHSKMRFAFRSQIRAHGNVSRLPTQTAFRWSSSPNSSLSPIMALASHHRLWITFISDFEHGWSQEHSWTLGVIGFRAISEEKTYQLRWSRNFGISRDAKVRQQVGFRL